MERAEKRLEKKWSANRRFAGRDSDWVCLLLKGWGLPPTGNCCLASQMAIDREKIGNEEKSENNYNPDIDSAIAATKHSC